MTNELNVIPFDQTAPHRLDGEIVSILPEYQGYWDFYALLRQATVNVINLAEKLLRDDPDVADPVLFPEGHRQDAMTKYGIYGPIPSMPATLGAYHLARLD